LIVVSTRPLEDARGIHFTCTQNKNVIVFLSVNYIDQSIGTENDQGEATMRQFTFAAATVAIAALFAAAPASADHVQGGPIKKGGQCWIGSKGMDGGTWGTWGACPASASTSAAVHRRVLHHS
jgi:hypothetical protein